MLRSVSPRKLFILVLLGILLVWGIRLAGVVTNGYHEGGWGTANAASGFAGYPHYNSDDVAQQNFLWDWQHGLKQGVVVGTDNYFLKYPLYFVANNLPVSPLKQLVITSAVVLVVTASLAFYSYYSLIRLLIANRKRQLQAILVAGLALAALPIESFIYIKMPILRNIELGLFLVLVLQLFHFDRRPDYLEKRKNLKIYGSALLLAMLLADDPLFVFTALAPLYLVVLTACVLKKRLTRKYLGLLAVMTAGYLGSVLLRALLSAVLPMQYYVPKIKLANLQGLLANLKVLRTDGLKMFGIDFWDGRVGKASIVIAVISMVLLCVYTYSLVQAVVRKPRSLSLTYLLTLIVWVPFALSITTAYDRYLQIVVFVLPIAAILAIKHLDGKRLRRGVVVSLSLILLATLAACVPPLVQASGQPKLTNQPERIAINQLETLQLKKGYANYWHSAIQTNLSGHKLDIIGTACTGGNLVIPDLLVEHAEVASSTDRSFYLYYPGDTLDCPPETLVSQLGQPAYVIQPTQPNQPVIAIYDYDIGSRLHYLTIH